MFDSLSSKLDKAFQLLKGHGRITEINVAETLKEVRRALLDADVNYKTAKDFTETEWLSSPSPIRDTPAGISMNCPGS